MLSFAAGHRTEFLTCQWRALAMLNYEVSVATVQPFVPRGCEVDTHDGRTFASLVGFLFRDTRVLGFRVPWHVHFEEVNLRIYVRRRVGDEVRRGVVFIRELVPRWAVRTVARWLYNEPYWCVPMSHTISGFNDAWDSPSTSPSAEYRWRLRGREYAIGVEADGAMSSLIDGEHSHFIAEHYWGYGRRRDGGTMEYRVEHPPWQVWAAKASHARGDFAQLYGEPWGEVLKSQPYSAFLAQGSEVRVTSAERIA